jgi:hypothetical protein
MMTTDIALEGRPQIPQGLKFLGDFDAFAGVFKAWFSHGPAQNYYLGLKRNENDFLWQPHPQRPVD